MKILLGVVFLLGLLALILGGELYSQVGRYQTYWNRRNQQPANKGELVYVALGDSTAQGIGASKPQNGYVGLIAKELEKRFDQPVRTLNFSKTRAKLSDALERQLPLLEKCNIPGDAIVTVEIGANDMGSFNAAEFEAQMDELMRRLPRQTIISDMPYFGGGRFKHLETNVQQANLIVHRLAKKHNFRTANLHEYTSKDNWLRDYAVDRFHPSNYNYKTAWAPAFLEQIKPTHETKF